MSNCFHDLSERIHVFSRGETWICFDKYTNRVFELDYDEFVCLQTVLSSNTELTLSQDEKIFLQNFYNALGNPILEYRELEDINTFYLRVNNDCNLKCKYCRAISTDGVTDKKLLSPDVAAIAAKKMWNLGAKGVGLHGGDPIIDWNNTSKVIRAIRKATPKMEIGLTCNGTLINDNIAQELKDFGVRVSVELDGGKHTHDDFKRFPNGESSYYNALHGAEILKNYGILAAIESTVSGLKGYDDKGYKSLQEKFKDIPIVVSRIKSQKISPWTCHGDDLKQFFREQLNTTNFSDNIFNDVIAGIVNLLSDPIFPLYRCICFVDKVSINIDGSVFLCPKKEDEYTFISNIREDSFIASFAEKRVLTAKRFSEKEIVSVWYSNLIEYCVDSTFQNVIGQDELHDEEELGQFFEDLIYLYTQIDISELSKRWFNSGF